MCFCCLDSVSLLLLLVFVRMLNRIRRVRRMRRRSIIIRRIRCMNRIMRNMNMCSLVV